MNLTDLKKLSAAQLVVLAEQYGLENMARLKKQEIISLS